MGPVQEAKGIKEEKEKENEIRYPIGESDSSDDSSSDSSDDEIDGSIRLDPPRSMTDDEVAEYRRQVAKSGGFEVDKFEGVLPGAIGPCFIDEKVEQLLIDLSTKALQVYNDDNKTSLEFDHYIRANGQCVAGRMYYITFAALSDGKSQTFRAKVWHKPYDWGSEVQFIEMAEEQV